MSIHKICLHEGTRKKQYALICFLFKSMLYRASSYQDKSTRLWLQHGKIHISATANHMLSCTVAVLVSLNCNYGICDVFIYTARDFSFRPVKCKQFLYSYGILSSQVLSYTSC